MRDTEKIRQLFGVIEPEKMRESSRHEHFEGDEVALAKLVVKKREKPGKFLRPHGMILLFWEFCIFLTFPIYAFGLCSCGFLIHPL
jgi:hypothetical protein